MIDSRWRRAPVALQLLLLLFIFFLSAGDIRLLHTMINYLNAALIVCLTTAVNGFVVPSPAAFSSRTATLAKATYSQVCSPVGYIASLCIFLRRCQCVAKYKVSASCYMWCAVLCQCREGLGGSLAVPPCLRKILDC